jgi:hypothetical protein
LVFLAGPKANGKRMIGRKGKRGKGNGGSREGK